MIKYNQSSLSTYLVIAYYNKHRLLTKDFIDLLNFVKDDFNCILAYVSEIENKNEAPSVHFIKYGDIGYDGNCFKVGLEEVMSRNIQTKIIFINNSILITSKTKFKNLLLGMILELNKTFFLGFSESKEIRPHYQSFMFGINLNNANSKTKKYLQKITKHNPTLDRNDVINKFELETIKILNRLHAKHTFYNRVRKLEKLIAYINFIAKLGFFNNLNGLVNYNTINFTLYNKNITGKFGFKKIKNGKGLFPHKKLTTLIWKKVKVS